ncbi:MAG: hypothetical protein GX861_01145 [Tenericutes bacterium]|jgi:hypothetical protein|nr:hypothetical protein [Mycoplasmatota bacterium]
MEDKSNIYLIPANAKRGSLIFNVFRSIDLIIFGIGFAISMILIMFVPMNNLVITILVLSPALITGFLVIPIPNYHNVLTVLLSIIRYIQGQKIYKWKGWCIYEED